MIKCINLPSASLFSVGLSFANDSLVFANKYRCTSKGGSYFFYSFKSVYSARTLQKILCMKISNTEFVFLGSPFKMVDVRSESKKETIKQGFGARALEIGKGYAVTRHLLEILLVVKLCGITVQRDSLLGTISQDFERLKGALIIRMMESEALSGDH